MSKFVICTLTQWNNDITQINYDGYYTTIIAWEAARDGVDTADENSIVHIYNTHDIGDNTLDVNGWVDKDSSHYMEVTRSEDGSKHDGTVDGSGDTLISGESTVNVLLFRINRLKIHDLRVWHDAASTSPFIWHLSAGGKLEIYNNVLKQEGAGTLFNITPSSAHEMGIYNNFIIATDIGTNYTFSIADAENDDNLIINNSLYIGTAGRGFSLSAANTNKMRNNLNFAQSVWYNADSTSASYEGVPCADGAAYDPDGVNCVYNLTAADIFFDLTGGTEDLRLDPAGSDFSKIDIEGLGPSSDADVPSTDILGNTRSGTTCSIGAFEYIAAGGVTVDATLGTMVIAGKDTVINVGVIIDCTSGSLNISSLNPNVSIGTLISASSGSVNVISLNPNVSVGTSIFARTGVIDIAGIGPDISVGSTVSCSVGQIAITGKVVDIILSTDIEVTKGSISIQGKAAQVTSTILVAANQGLITIDSFNPLIQAGISTPQRRIYAIDKDNRVYTIGADGRIYIINFDDRIYPIT
ncbi:MAG: hypothetical protein DRH26_03460 [Deltaproteobacteria bacterium]|nr:MAG: hypothetical protein DRH26_03460 [Deltaproteobacteria bacterium]